MPTAEAVCTVAGVVTTTQAARVGRGRWRGRSAGPRISFCLPAQTKLRKNEGEHARNMAAGVRAALTRGPAEENGHFSGSGRGGQLTRWHKPPQTADSSVVGAGWRAPMWVGGPRPAH